MKKIILFLLLFPPLTAAQAQEVRFQVNDGLDNPVLQAKIESNISLLLTEIDAAFSASRPLNLASVTISEDAATSLRMLWRNRPFFCDEPLVVERVLRTYDGGWQVRNIPIELRNADNVDAYQELVIDMDAAGTITLVNMAIESNLYRQIVNEGTDDVDKPRRQQILNYVEQFRTAYDKKDIDFMEMIFSDDALIITGKVVRRGGKDRTHIKGGVEYRKQSKSEYLQGLRRVFESNEYIHVSFSGVQVTRHPSKEGYYGVLVKQGYKSSNYEDEGYVFMLWDFRNEGHPQIHVRTWQPYWLDQQHTKALEQNQIITINSFEF